MTYLNLPFQIPGYHIVRRLGLGGMATVYLATQDSLGRQVAIKVLASERAPSEELVKRFENEARVIAQLDHPHIVSVYEVGRTSNGQIYYTMPYLPNGDLSSRMLRDDPERILAIMHALAQALSYAHNHGIVHRDVKPENVLFDALDRPLLADFGIALGGRKAISRVTREGATVGSSGYMSPEQARGMPLDGRSDLYSLGVVCYEMLTGEVPFHGSDALSTALAHVENPVPRLPATRRVWQPLIDRALAKSPDERFQSAEELLLALDAVEKRLHAPVSSTPKWKRLSTRRRVLAYLRRYRKPALLAALGIAALLAVIVIPRALIHGFAPGSRPLHAPESPPAATAPATPAETHATSTTPAVVPPPPVEPPPAITAAATPPIDEAPPVAIESADLDLPPLDETPSASEPIEAQLQRARQHLAAGKIAAPPGDNAAEDYLGVLLQDPSEVHAKAGLARVLALLGRNTATALTSGDLNQVPTLVRQGTDLVAQAKLAGTAAEKGFIQPIRTAVENLRKQRRNAFEIGPIERIKPVLPTLARIDPALAASVTKDLDAAALFLRDGGPFRDANGPALIVVPAAKASKGAVDHGFAVSVDPVSRTDYARFAGATGRAASRCRESQNLFARTRGLDWRNPGFKQGEDHPVVCVSWADANAYAAWLSQRTGQTYRLPSNVEWLYAARAAAAGTACTATNIGKRSGREAACNDGFENTSPIGRFPSTAPGLRDIAGNVSEWIDPCSKAGQPTTACKTVRFRGLSWADDDRQSNLLKTGNADANTGYITVGFRVVRDLPSGR